MKLRDQGKGPTQMAKGLGISRMHVRRAWPGPRDGSEARALLSFIPDRRSRANRTTPDVFWFRWRLDGPCGAAEPPAEIFRCEAGRRRLCISERVGTYP